MTDKKQSKQVNPPGRQGKNGTFITDRSAKSEKTFTTSHNKDKIGKPKPGGG